MRTLRLLPMLAVLAGLSSPSPKGVRAQEDPVRAAQEDGCEPTSTLVFPVGTARLDLTAQADLSVAANWTWAEPGRSLMVAGPTGPLPADAQLDDDGGRAVQGVVDVGGPAQGGPGAVERQDPPRERADQGEPQSSGKTVTIPLRSGGGRGTYLVSYRVISADSHPVAGSLTYSVGAASAPPGAELSSRSVTFSPFVN